MQEGRLISCLFILYILFRDEDFRLNWTSSCAATSGSNPTITPRENETISVALSPLTQGNPWNARRL